jgi:hypothetical protein
VQKRFSHLFMAFCSFRLNGLVIGDGDKALLLDDLDFGVDETLLDLLELIL